MSSKDKKAKRERAFNKLVNQLSVLSHTTTKKDQKVVAQLQELTGTLSIA